MNNEIRILSIEDVPADTEMINHELRRAGLMFRTKRVEPRPAFLHQLAHDPPDVILSDHGLPSFDGCTALAIAREKYPEVLFIFVISSLGEEKMIELFENGAAHCVLKNRLCKTAAPSCTGPCARPRSGGRGNGPRPSAHESAWNRTRRPPKSKP